MIIMLQVALEMPAITRVLLLWRVLLSSSSTEREMLNVKEKSKRRERERGRERGERDFVCIDM